jgi:hypothetical protein
MLAGAGLSRCWPHDRAHQFFARARWNADDLGLAVAKLVVALLAPAHGTAAPLPSLPREGRDAGTDSVSCAQADTCGAARHAHGPALALCDEFRQQITDRFASSLSRACPRPAMRRTAHPPVPSTVEVDAREGIDGAFPPCGPGQAP